MEDSPKRRGRPPTEAGTPPAYAIRVPRELMDAARATAAARQENVPEVVRRALAAYVRRHAQKEPQP